MSSRGSRAYVRAVKAGSICTNVLVQVFSKKDEGFLDAVGYQLYTFCGENVSDLAAQIAAYFAVRNKMDEEYERIVVALGCEAERALEAGGIVLI